MAIFIYPLIHTSVHPLIHPSIHLSTLNPFNSFHDSTLLPIHQCIPSFVSPFSFIKESIIWIFDRLSIYWSIDLRRNRCEPSDETSKRQVDFRFHEVALHVCAHVGREPDWGLDASNHRRSMETPSHSRYLRYFILILFLFIIIVAVIILWFLLLLLFSLSL